MYHDVIKEGGEKSISGFNIKGADDYKIRAKDFEKQLGIAAEFSKRTEKKIIFTFDDGGQSAIEIIAPVLEKYGIIGIFFIPTSYIDEPGFLTQNDILKLSEMGHIIGSHSHYHQPMMNRMTYEENLEEWKTSCEILSGIISKPIIHASVPGGWYAPVVGLAASGTGIQYLYTSEPVTTISKERACAINGRFSIRDDTNPDTFQSLLEGKNMVRETMNLKWKLGRIAKRFY